MTLLPSAPHHQSAEKFTAPIPAGLRSLLVAPDDGRRRGVLTRAAAAVSCRGGGGGGGNGRASGDGTSTVGHDEGITEGSAEEEEDLDGFGFWVSYGRRCPRRRLPPPIPSLVARGALRRTRTDDGRLVIRIVPVVRPECIRARRRGDRLTMQLVEHEDDPPMMAPPLREPAGAREEDDVRVAQALEDGHDTATATPAAGEEDVGDDGEGATVAVAREWPDIVPPPRVSSAGCFEDVFKYNSIGSSSLRQMPSLRMVH